MKLRTSSCLSLVATIGGALVYSAPGMGHEAVSGIPVLEVSGPGWDASELAVDDKVIHLDLRGRPLGNVLAAIEQHSGIVFVLPPHLRKTPVRTKADVADWDAAWRVILNGFNHLDRQTRDGTVERVTVTGYAGDGADSTSSPSQSGELKGERLFTYQGEQSGKRERPQKFAGLPRGSVMPIQIDRDRLSTMKPGEELPLVLPTGQYDVIQDNRVVHENGDLTWIGYLKEDGKQFRAIITIGANGSFGQISTPEGLYQIEPEDGSNWLVDVAAARLKHSPYHNKEQIPEPMLVGPSTVLESDKATGMRKPQQAAGVTGTQTTTTTPSAGTTTTSLTTVDLMVLYTSNFATGGVATRLNNLVAISNQAYLDSQVAMKLRLVKSAPVSYTETNSNSTALSELTRSSGVFANVKTLRSQSGADMVSLLRPFNYTAQKSCGTAWLNGANGGTLNASYAYSVVSDGRSGSYYCADYSMVHELSHNMGSAHDRANSSTQGKYSYSYGYGLSGTFGTIMSYFNPRVGLFSNPGVNLCKGYPCGIDASSPAAANNALSLNNVRGIVAGFMPSVAP